MWYNINVDQPFYNFTIKIMETNTQDITQTSSQSNIDLFKTNYYREEIFRRVFCDFENYVWKWDIAFLTKVHDFCQKSHLFADIADRIYYARSDDYWNDDFYNIVVKFLDSIIPNRYINTHVQKDSQTVFTKEEISYIRKRVLAFTYYPDKTILEDIQHIKSRVDNVVYLKDYHKKK